MLERVKYDTTPKAEKSQYFDSPQDARAPADMFDEKPKQLALPETKGKMSFKHFILESEPGTPDTDE
ncbi:hypothetical protein LTR53_020673, partial [Teratosphaeriaceae sp. CCFEE 6253]